jgi:FkbM family methyltransferase
VNGAAEIPLEQWLDDLLSEPVEAARARARTAFDEETSLFNGRFVLFGAGNMGRRILACLRQDGRYPLAFADNQSSQWGKTIDGLEVLSPGDAVTRYGDNAVFIVTIYNNQHSFPDTRNQLSGLGCTKVVSVISLRWKYHETFLPYYRDDLPHRALLQAPAIRDAYALWSDELSRREYVAQVAWRLHGDFDLLGRPDPEGEYFPAGLIRPRADEFFVDVGAYDGDTVLKFVRRQSGAFRGALALEPDPQNYGKLLRCLAGLPGDISRRIASQPLAASSRARRLRFNSGEGMAASLNELGRTEVECVRLDDLLEECHPSYIKMDVEGAEMEAIEGCRRILAKDRPVLAVCVYHAPDHLWTVPVAIRRACPQYRFFLRPHMPECWDTVCYAVPPDRARTAEA